MLLYKLLLQGCFILTNAKLSEMTRSLFCNKYIALLKAELGNVKSIMA